MNGDQAEQRATLRSEAAHWLNFRLSGDMAIEDEQRFRAWFDQCDEHRDAYQRLDRAWAVSRLLAGDPALSATRMQVAEPRFLARHRRSLSIAASLLLVIGAGWMALPYAQPGIEAQDQQQQAFRTGTGQRTRVTLPDGSVVTLDAETEMRLHSSRDERRLDLLRGRAFFRVAHDPSRPFIVHAAGKRVRAIGTAFDVSNEDGNVVVTLVEGKVRVDGSAAGSDGGTDMTPGRQLVISRDLNWTLRRVDVAKEVSWTQGRLIFMDDPLSKAIADVNRYSTRKLIFKDGQIPDRQIVGVFEAGDIEGFVRAMELHDIAHRISSSTDEIVLAVNE